MARGKIKLAPACAGSEVEDWQLTENRSLSYGAPDAANMLIYGDNLAALQLLEARCAASIKCIFIDPPYNTGSMFEHYDDGADSDVWLSQMRQRLKLMRRLLRPDGVIAVQIDYREAARLKLLLDEVFDRQFRNEIIVKRGTKNVQHQFDTIDALASGHDSILLYANSPDTRFRHCMSQLDKPQPGTWNNHWRGTNRPTMRYEIFGIRPESGQWRWSEERTRGAMRNHEQYLAETGGQMSIDDYYLSKLQTEGIALNFVRLSRTGKPEHYVPPRSYRILSDLWLDIPMSGSITRFPHEKHEALLFRILHWLTDEGDWVLDAYLGTGTTAAAAHKMNRRWIGIESGTHIHDFALPRLKRVVDGSCRQGISTQLDWQGGGGFRGYELASAHAEHAHPDIYMA
ncbi:adenine specific DNA methylase Mod [Paenibacillus phyllosphaerae]|uniref:Methyltransferase n=1 Tax=Paenibacillus phyllosphaerae TaxID=274593 RepID=A0A7W5FQV0_9BACL|nr:site-specific DNA-methyltransferase [Paenibacillus phyllosphaerae]MBB3113607.1 adenine specific DNA methylase Mod [Paenibacillus phyllosphaerae]